MPEPLPLQVLTSFTASSCPVCDGTATATVVDECVQLHGGYGFMLEYPIARAYIDTRANRIYGGTNEIMKELISRSI